MKLFGIFAYTFVSLVLFDFIYIYCIATNPAISPSNKGENMESRKP